MRSSPICVRALSSMPTTQIHVMPMMNTMPSARLHQSLFARLVEPEQQERVLGRDQRQARHDDEVGHQRAPPAEPAGARTHRARDPGEVRAAVGVGSVQVEERRRDAAHRDERDPHDRGRLEPHVERHEPERCGDAVGRCRGRDPDDGRRRQPECPRLQTLALGHATRSGLDLARHEAPLCRRSSVPTRPTSTNGATFAAFAPLGKGYRVGAV